MTAICHVMDMMITIVIEQHVFWFQISVDDPLLVQVLHTLDDLSCVKTGSGLVKARVVLIHQVDVVPGTGTQQVRLGSDKKHMAFDKS